MKIHLCVDAWREARQLRNITDYHAAASRVYVRNDCSSLLSRNAVLILFVRETVVYVWFVWCKLLFFRSSFYPFTPVYFSHVFILSSVTHSIFVASHMCWYFSHDIFGNTSLFFVFHQAETPLSGNVHIYACACKKKLKFEADLEKEFIICRAGHITPKRNIVWKHSMHQNAAEFKLL